MSSVPYIQSPLMFQQPQEKCSHAYTLQQKLQATKLKLKSKRPTTNKSDSSKIYESKIVRNQKLTNIIKLTKQHKNNRLNITFNKLNEFKSTKNLDSSVETINKLPNNSCNITQKIKSNKTPNNKLKLFSKQTKVPTGKLPSPISITTNLHNPKSMYIDLDSVAEQSRLKSTILQDKSSEKKNTTPVTLNPSMLLSSCPGLSITPVINSNTINHKSIECLTLQQVQNTSTASKSINIEQLQHLSNGLTITKSEKTAMQIQRPN